jgi:hypothetical protein
MTDFNRCIRRVPLDFAAPLNAHWEGYINPYHEQFEVCEHCKGIGISKEARALERIWYGTPIPNYAKSDNLIDFGQIDCELGFVYHFTRSAHTTHSPMYLTALRYQYQAYVEFSNHSRQSHLSWEDYQVKSPRAREIFERVNSAWMYLLDAEDVAALEAAKALVPLTSTWKRGQWVPLKDAEPLTPDRVNISTYETNHGMFNEWIVIEAFCARNHLAFKCPHCYGKGGRYSSNLIHFKACNWLPSDPPDGDGYQLWAPGIDGGPLSPVFEKAEDLLDWIVGQGIRYNHAVKRIETLALIKKGDRTAESRVPLIWLFRAYRMRQTELFHPAKMQPYSRAQSYLASKRT